MPCIVEQAERPSLRRSMEDEMLDKNLDVFVRQAHGRHAVLAHAVGNRVLLLLLLLRRALRAPLWDLWGWSSSMRTCCPILSNSL